MADGDALVWEARFAQLYRHVESCHYVLPLLCLIQQQRYMTTGSSGVFQLIYGFHTPPVVHEAFARHYGLGKGGSVTYESSGDLAQGMMAAIAMSPWEYSVMAAVVAERADAIYARSLSNMKKALWRA